MRTIFRRTAACLVTLAAVGCAHGAPQPSVLAPPFALADKVGFVEVADSVRLFYRVLGDRGDTVVVLHGGPGFHQNYLVPDLLPLAAHHTLLFFDQRNAGRSTLLADTARANVRHLVADMEVLRRHFQLERLTLLGHSWGGLLAGLYASEFPERVKRMILVGAMPPDQAPMRSFDPMARLDAAADLDRRRNLSAYRAGPPDSTKACWDYYALWIRGYFAVPVEARRTWGDLCNVPQAAMLNATRSYAVQSRGAWDLTSRLSRVTAPVLVIHGDEDPMPLSSAHAWVRALPDARLLLFPGSAHSPHVDRPAAFFTASEAFLAGGWPDSSVLAARTAAVVLEGDSVRSSYLAARASIAAVEDALVAAVDRADWPAAAALYAEDAFIFAPGAPPVVGRQAIAAFWRTLAHRGLRSLELQLMDLEGSGDRLQAVGKYVMRGGAGEPLDVGKFLAAYRREDGRWRLYADVLNSSMETRSPLEVPDYLTPPR